jgi:hypothetical protein
MNTKFLVLVVAGSALVSALSSFDSVSAATLNMNLDNVTYNLKVQSDKFQDEQTDITSTAWLSNSSLAKTIINQLGVKKEQTVPRFAYTKKKGEIQINFGLSDINAKSGYNADFTPITSNTILMTTRIVRTIVSSTQASTTALPDPLSALTAGCRFWRCL